MSDGVTEKLYDATEAIKVALETRRTSKYAECASQIRDAQRFLDEALMRVERLTA